jgi:zinc/manganese transport system permease protein
MLTPSWNPVNDWQMIFQYAFMRNALAAGTITAIMAGVIGYFVVLRGMAFASHTLANIGFAGAAGAVVVGLNPSLGLLVFTLAGALGMGVLGKRLYTQELAVGMVLAMALAAGLLFISLYKGYATNVYAILFGEVLGITQSQVLLSLTTGIVTLLVIAVLARPLLFATLDPEVARARGLPVAVLGGTFLVLLGLAVVVALQIVGVLLIFALLVAPAAIAERLTCRPPAAIGISIGLALIFTWGGMIIAYYLPYPLGFFITTLAFATYLGVRGQEALRSRLRSYRSGQVSRQGAPG